jgi:hypothetical protein
VANIFYCGGSSGRLGVLRAVMPISDLRPLVSAETRDYLGESFPKLNDDISARTVMEIVQEEQDEGWKTGFYLFEKTPPHFEEALRAFCKATGRRI